LPDLVLQRANNRSFEKFNHTAKRFFLISATIAQWLADFF